MEAHGRDADEPKGTISFSVRLTGKERERLTEAAAKRGWSLTSLMKTAALEKAAHILNTSAPNRIDFRGIAEEIARQVFAHRTVEKVDFADGEPGLVPMNLHSDLSQAILEQDPNAAVLTPCPVSPDFLTPMRDAARFGGTDFLDLIVQACEATVTRNRPDLLPPPIDPSLR
jgi:uncharacterized protein (DUF1778 family)